MINDPIVYVIIYGLIKITETMYKLTTFSTLCFKYTDLRVIRLKNQYLNITNSFYYKRHAWL